MSYLSFLIALLIVAAEKKTAGLTFYEGLDYYLDKVVGIEEIFLTISLFVMAVVVLTAIATVVVSKADVRGVYCGCLIVVVAILWPLLEFITLSIARALASSVDPSGIIDPTTFWVAVILMVLLGAG